MKFYITFICFLFIFNQASSQTYQSQTFNSNQKLAFAKIYLATQNLSLNLDSMVQQVVQKSGLSDQRLKEILMAGLNLEKVNLNKNEQDALIFFKEAQDIFDLAKEKKINELCLNEKFEASQFELMLKVYKNNVSFQHEMKPFFTQIIERP
jgi:hypothetical protein